jgi:nucleotide-binding universal stress UspA family protein
VLDPLPTAVNAEHASQMEEMMIVRREEAERYLAKVVEPLADKGMRVERAVRGGKAAETIAAVANETRADLIAMATHGRSGLGRLLFGSVAEGVLRTAAVPVLLFKTGEREW